MSTKQKEASKATSKKIKKLKDIKEIASKKDQGDILGERLDKKFKKLAESKEAQLQADDFDAGLDRAERRAAKEVALEAGIPMAKGGRAGLKGGGISRRGLGRAFMKGKRV
tara:strand:- start:327 stop:659 length:333 start_codon:yes stop_codon:yes gene_type:complete